MWQKKSTAKPLQFSSTNKFHTQECNMKQFSAQPTRKIQTKRMKIMLINSDEPSTDVLQFDAQQRSSKSSRIIWIPVMHKP